MFQVLAGERKRRVISPTTIVASVAAHVLLLGGAVYAAAGDGGETGPVREDTTIVWQADDPPPPPDPVEPPPPQQPAQPDQPPPTPGETLQLPTPIEVPEGVKPEAPDVKPVDPAEYSGRGPIGEVIGPPPPDPTPLTGSTTPPRGEDYVPGVEDVEKLPDLDRNALSRVLERHYPPVLRDSRVSGRVVIELIVNEDGRVREGSARVVEASHPAFGEAALRAVDRFRFRPAEMAGVPVPVRVTIPIQWTVPR